MAESVSRFRYLFNFTWPFCLILAGNLGVICGIIFYGLFLLAVHCFRAKVADEVTAKSIWAKGEKKSPLRSKVEHYQLIAHRGGGIDAPENTIEAIRKAAENGADAVEVDVAITKDGSVVLLHDDTLDRTTDGSGQITNTMSKDLRNLDAAAKHPLKEVFGTCRIPAIEKVIEECLKLDLKIYLDCKSSTDPSKILELYQKYPALYTSSVVCSFYPWILYPIGRKDPKIVRALTHRAMVNLFEDDYATFKDDKLVKRMAMFGLDKLLDWCLYSWLWYICGASGWLLFSGDTTRNFVNKWRKIGMETVVWTPNLPSQQKYFGDHMRCPLIIDTLRDDYVEDTKKDQ